MVKAIAGQTLRGVTERDAVDAFTARLQALSTAHDVLLQQTWSSANIGALVEKVLRLHAEEHRLAISGPHLSLGPRAGLSLSLLLHELATNAIKYGALSNDTGRVSLTWSIAERDGEAMFSLSWQEQGGPPVAEPAKRGFGSRLIRMGLGGNGAVDMRYEPDGLVGVFEAPVSMIQEVEG